MSSVQLSTFENIRLNTNIGLISSVLFAIFTGLGAFLVIPLPFTPIPITGQTFVVLLSGFALGRKYGPLSQTIYIFLGILGVPWFAEGSSGWDVVIGATGGYLVGFILASFLIGYLSDISSDMRKPAIILLIATLGTVSIYISGILGLMIVANLNLWTSLLLGFFPFLPGDILKIVLVFISGYLILPQEKSNADQGMSPSRYWQIIFIAITISILTVSLFVSYLLFAGSTPPVNLAAFSLLASFIVLPSLLLLLRFQRINQ